MSTSCILAAGAISPDQLTRLLLAVAVLLGLAKLLGELAHKLKQPAVLGEIMAGVILGPTILGALAPEVAQWLFPIYAEGSAATEAQGSGGYSANYLILEGLVVLSVVLLLLVAGLEVDLSSVRRQGKAAMLVSTTGLVIPFVLGFTTAWLLPEAMGMDQPRMRLIFALFVGVALSITALPVIARILMDLNMAKSDIGVLVMSSAMANDLVGWIGFALILAMLPATGVVDVAAPSGGDVLMTVVLTFLFLGVMLTLGRRAAAWALPHIQANLTWPGGVLVFVLVTGIAAAAVTEWIGIHAIFGAFIAGVAIGDSRHMSEHARETIHQFVTHFFAPLFFATIGLRISFIEHFDLPLVLLVLVVACVGKIGGCYLGARWAKMSHRDSWAVGFGMVARGAMEIILAQLAFQAGLIGERLFVAIVIMALVTSMISGPAMQKILRRRQPRRLVAMLKEEQWVAEMRSGERRHAIDELAAVAARLTGLPADVIGAAVWRREQLMPTGLPHGLAVPHARLEALHRPVVIVGRSNPGIDFDAPDGGPAHLICMMLVPEADTEAQIELLDAIARAFGDDRARAEAMAAANFTEFRAAISAGDARQMRSG